MGSIAAHPYVGLFYDCCMRFVKWDGHAAVVEESHHHVTSNLRKRRGKKKKIMKAYDIINWSKILMETGKFIGWGRGLWSSVVAMAACVARDSSMTMNSLGSS